MCLPECDSRVCSKILLKNWVILCGLKKLKKKKNSCVRKHEFTHKNGQNKKISHISQNVDEKVLNLSLQANVTFLTKMIKPRSPWVAEQDCRGINGN